MPARAWGFKSPPGHCQQVGYSTRAPRPFLLQSSSISAWANRTYVSLPKSVARRSRAGRKEWGAMRIHRCPRCRAEDISADAHPTRLLQNGQHLQVFVCRNCFRAAELEYRIACETNGLPYAPLGIRDALKLLSDFYLDRLADWKDPDLLVDDDQREAATAPIRAALADIERRRAIEPV